MMPEKYKKLCVKCSKEFESKGNRCCPYCGSDEWYFIDDAGKKRNFFAEALAKRQSAIKEIKETIRRKSQNNSIMTDAEADALIRKFNLKSSEESYV